MIIKKYNKITDVDGSIIGFELELDGKTWLVPLDPSNRHYQMIKADYLSKKKKPFKFDFK